MNTRSNLANRIKRIPEFITFCLVGGMNTGVDFAVFTMLTFWSVPVWMAQTISYSCGVLNSFLMNRAWTFKRPKRLPKQPASKTSSQFVRFAVLNLITLTVTYGFIIEFQQRLHWPLLLSKLIATGLSLGINFTGSRLWVFREA